MQQQQPRRKHVEGSYPERSYPQPGMREPRGWGVDRALESRPGFPLEHAPEPSPGAHWVQPEHQRKRARMRITRRRELKELTPVYGTAQPLHGLSGVLRWCAYRISSHKPSHWFLLRGADRVDVLESATGEAIRRSPVKSGSVLLGASLAFVLIGALGSGALRRANPLMRERVHY